MSSTENFAPGSSAQKLHGHCRSGVSSKIRAPTLNQSQKLRQKPCAGGGQRQASTVRALAPARCRLRACDFCGADPPSRYFVTSGGRSASFVSSLPVGTGVDGTGRGRPFSASPLPLLSSLLPFPSLGGGRSPVADSLFVLTPS